MDICYTPQPRWLRRLARHNPMAGVVAEALQALAVVDAIEQVIEPGRWSRRSGELAPAAPTQRWLLVFVPSAIPTTTARGNCGVRPIRPFVGGIEADGVAIAPPTPTTVRTYDRRTGAVISSRIVAPGDPGTHVTDHLAHDLELLAQLGAPARAEHLRLALERGWLVRPPAALPVDDWLWRAWCAEGIDRYAWQQLIRPIRDRGGRPAAATKLVIQRPQLRQAMRAYARESGAVSSEPVRRALATIAGMVASGQLPALPTPDQLVAAGLVRRTESGIAEAVAATWARGPLESLDAPAGPGATRSLGSTIGNLDQAIARTEHLLSLAIRPAA